MSGARHRRRWRGGWPSWPTRKRPRTIVVLDMRELVSYTDFLAICTARNERQARAIVDEVRLQAEAGGRAAARRRRRGGRGGLGRARLPRLRAPRLHRRGARALPARGPLARGAAAGARPRRSGSVLGRKRLASAGEAPALDGRARSRRNGVRGTPTVPRMGSFKRALLGYRRRRCRRGDRGPGRADRVARAHELPSASAGARDRRAGARAHVALGDGDRARARDPRPQRAAAGGERTPRPQHRLARRGLGAAGGDPGPGARPGDADPDEGAARGGRGEPPGAGADRGAGAVERKRARGERRWPGESVDGLFEGVVKVEIGPLGDFSQLVGFEDAVGQLGATEISVERFSEGRATLDVRLDEPVDLLRELEELSPLDFKVRHTAGQPRPRRRRGRGPRAARRLARRRSR